MIQKNFHLFLITVLFLVAFQLQAQTAYVTKTGAKYHKESCRYAKTGWAATLAEAKKRGLTACLVCQKSTKLIKMSEQTFKYLNLHKIK